MELILMRGLPGSGKSTLAKALGGEVYSTDFYFETDDGYKFDVTKLSEAHLYNQYRVAVAMRKRCPLVIVDNTNTQLWEMLPYAKLAILNGYTISIREPETEWARNPAELAKRNTHGVPLQAIERMLSRWQEVTVDQLIAAAKSS